jgi:hypothetical protein
VGALHFYRKTAGILVQALEYLFSSAAGDRHAVSNAIARVSLAAGIQHNMEQNCFVKNCENKAPLRNS